MQQSLFGAGPPAIEIHFDKLHRHQLGDGAWVDHLPGYLQGHQELFDVLARGTRWQQQRRRMYERIVDVPRLIASFPANGPGHPLLTTIAERLGQRYEALFVSISAALYRDGRDSVAWHGDKVLRDQPQALVATISLGSPRPFLLRPVGGGKSRTFKLGWGDLVVMGGTCQTTWEHCVPKVRHADPRVSVMFREEVPRRVWTPSGTRMSPAGPPAAAAPHPCEPGSRFVR